MKISKLLRELLRRKVIRTGVIYAAAAWLVIEVVTTVLPTIGASDVLVRVVVIALIAGLPLSMLLSWIFDLSPEGLRLEMQSVRPASPALGGEPPADVKRRIWNPPPAPPGSLIGREAALAEVRSMFLGSGQLVTITGPGGIGKTRFALEVAHRSGNSISGCFVQLAPLARAEDVLPAAARALGATQAEARSPAENIAALLGEKSGLLVLDNFEHVLDAAPDVATLMSMCSRLKVLVTSRAPLRIAGEREYVLLPLELPPDHRLPVEKLASFPAVRLFIERAAATGSALRLNVTNAEAVARVCRKLDGLPLALELAAARTRVLQPEALLERLDCSLDVLTTGGRDLPPRQRTLRATIDWSHSLLTPDEQVVFRRLAVFPGGWDHDAVESVCGGAGAVSMLDLLQSLVEQALVQPGDGGRFEMLQTIREYAMERLESAGEAAMARDRHAAYCHRLAQRVDAGLRGSDQLASMALGGADEPNLNDALEWCLERGRAGDADATEHGLQIAGALFLFWHIRGQHLSARQWTTALLDAPGGSRRTIGRARALLTAGLASWTLGQYDRARGEFREGYEIACDTGTAVERATLGLHYGAGQMSVGEVESARELLEESQCAARELDDNFSLSWSLTFLGMLDSIADDADSASRRLEEAANIQRRVGDREGEGVSVSALAQVRQDERALKEAMALYRQALTAFEAVGDRPEKARVLEAMAWCELADERVDEARQKFLESVQVYEEVGSVRGVGVAMFGLAACAAMEGNAAAAIRIAAAADVHASAVGIVNVYPSDSPARIYIEHAEAKLSAEEVARIRTDGQALSVREAVRYAAAARERELPAEL